MLGTVWTKRGRPAEGYLTKQGAQRELDAILADARRHRITCQPRLASTVTFAEAAREWLRYVEHDRKRRPSTITDYRWIVESRLPAFGSLALESITTQCRRQGVHGPRGHRDDDDLRPAALREASTGPPVPSVRSAA